MIENVESTDMADLTDESGTIVPNSQFLTEDFKQKSFTGGHPAIFALEITPEHYLHWQKYSRDPICSDPRSV